MCSLAVLATSVLAVGSVVGLPNAGAASTALLSGSVMGANGQPLSGCDGDGDGVAIRGGVGHARGGRCGADEGG